jgi:hypothetical protein
LFDGRDRLSLDSKPAVNYTFRFNAVLLADKYGGDQEHFKAEFRFVVCDPPSSTRSPDPLRVYYRSFAADFKLMVTNKFGVVRSTCPNPYTIQYPSNQYDQTSCLIPVLYSSLVVLRRKWQNLPVFASVEACVSSHPSAAVVSHILSQQLCFFA